MIDANLLGAIGFSRFIKAAGGVFLSSPPDGRAFRGDADVVAAVRAAGFEVRPFAGPRDPKVSAVAHTKAASRATTWIALTPVGAEVA